LTAHAAAKELDCAPQTIRRLCAAGEVACIWEETRRWGPQPRLTAETVEELKPKRCSYPGCDEPAPGPSGRCGEHAAGVKYPAERRYCARPGCDEDMGLIHGSRLKQGRGVYCSNRCKGLAHEEANPGRAASLNPDGARDHHRLVEEDVAAFCAENGYLTPEAAAEEVGVETVTLLWVHHYGGDLPGEVHRFRGSARLLFRKDDVRAFMREWSNGGDGRRRNWLRPDFVVANTRGRARARGDQLTLDDAEDLRQRAVQRSRRLGGFRGGPPTKDELHAQVVEIAREVIEEESKRSDPELRPNTVKAAVGHRHRQQHPEHWAGYTVEDERQQRNNVIARVQRLAGGEINDLIDAAAKALQTT
jgi:hypothetical protein